MDVAVGSHVSFKRIWTKGKEMNYSNVSGAHLHDPLLQQAGHFGKS